VSKSSIVTTRRRPVRPAAEEKAAGFLLKADTLTVQTDERIELVDLTDPLADFVHAAGVREGVLSVWSLHTTCAIFINEAQQALHADIKRVLEEIIERDAEWMHNDPDHSDCDRFNADAHLRAMLLGHSLTLQISGGELVLGQWQRVLAAELDGPRARTVRLQAMGIL
jgi:secondary thiamine-phosphate synthase enzyme